MQSKALSTKSDQKFQAPKFEKVFYLVNPVHRELKGQNASKIYLNNDVKVENEW